MQLGQVAVARRGQVRVGRLPADGLAKIWGANVANTNVGKFVALFDKEIGK
jgi:hypothetical protein